MFAWYIVDTLDEQGENRKAPAYENMSLLWVSLSRLGGAAAIHEQVQVKA